jgi:lipoate-protein ligase A
VEEVQGLERLGRVFRNKGTKLIQSLGASVLSRAGSIVDFTNKLIDIETSLAISLNRFSERYLCTASSK